MKTLDIIVRVLLITLMLLSVIGMFFYSDTIEQFTLYFVLLMISGIGSLTLAQITNQTKTK
jgi:hypothetical protein